MPMFTQLPPKIKIQIFECLSDIQTLENFEAAYPPITKIVSNAQLRFKVLSNEIGVENIDLAVMVDNALRAVHRDVLAESKVNGFLKALSGSASRDKVLDIRTKRRSFAAISENQVEDATETLGRNHLAVKYWAETFADSRIKQISKRNQIAPEPLLSSELSNIQKMIYQYWLIHILLGEHDKLENLVQVVDHITIDDLWTFAAINQFSYFIFHQVRLIVREVVSTGKIKPSLSRISLETHKLLKSFNLQVLHNLIANESEEFLHFAIKEGIKNATLTDPTDDLFDSKFNIYNQEVRGKPLRTVSLRRCFTTENCIHDQLDKGWLFGKDLSIIRDACLWNDNRLESWELHFPSAVKTEAEEEKTVSSPKDRG